MLIHKQVPAYTVVKVTLLTLLPIYLPSKHLTQSDSSKTLPSITFSCLEAIAISAREKSLHLINNTY